MTNALNRAAFEKIAYRQLEISNSINLPVSLVVADIDFFKRVNDTYSHLAGDDVIKSFSKTL